jgi:MoxR-like ATPase
MRLAVGYPDHAAEVSVLTSAGVDPAVDALPAVTGPEEVAHLIGVASRIHVAPALYDYLVTVVAATRTAPGVRLGASPRASVALLRAVRARAGAAGRAFATPSDVKALAVPVLSHRIVLTPESELRGRTAAEVVEETLASTPVPQGAAVGTRS